MTLTSGKVKGDLAFVGKISAPGKLGGPPLFLGGEEGSTAASKLCYYKYSKCCNKSTTICVNFAAIAVSLIIYICTVMLQLL